MKAKRPTVLMAAAQVICILAVPLTACLPLLEPGAHSCIITLRNLFLAACLIWVEAEAFCVCRRMRKSSAFSVKNEKALGRIVTALLAAGITVLIFGNSIVPFLLKGLPAVAPAVERLLLPFTLLTLALMVRAVQVLMRRAVDIQEENDLTI